VRKAHGAWGKENSEVGMRKSEMEKNEDQFIIKMIEQSDSTNPQSKIRNPKLLIKTDLTE